MSIRIRTDHEFTKSSNQTLSPKGGKGDETDGTTTAALDPGALPDGKNTVSFRSISSQFPNAIAVTYSWYYVNTKRVFEVDTIFNDDLPWSVNPYGASFTGSYDVRTSPPTRSATGWSSATSTKHATRS